jgi:hypothetical protein
MHGGGGGYTIKVHSQRRYFSKTLPLKGQCHEIFIDTVSRLLAMSLNNEILVKTHVGDPVIETVQSLH